MLKKILAGVGSVVFLLLSFVGVNAEELEMRPFLYTQNFEGEADPVKYWTSNGKFTVNFKGLTDEKAFSGKKSFKLDVTFHGGTFFYWKIPVSLIPTEGKLKFSGRILIEKGTTGTAGLGLNIVIPQITTGCKSFGSASSQDTEEWKLIEGNVVKLGKSMADKLAPKYIWGAKGENIDTYVNLIGLFLGGKKGQRVVVYVDDIKIEGELFTKAGHQKEIKRRMALVKEKVDKKIASWEEALKEIEEEFNSLTDLSPKEEKTRKEIEGEIDSIKTKVAVIKRRGKIRISEVEEIDVFLENIISHIRSISVISTKEDMLVYIVSPITSLKILPADTFIRGEISDEIRVIATPGEYESASFVISALSDIVSLKVNVSDLKGKKGVIPSSSIDIKVVKCWYQAGTAWVGISQDKTRRVLIPELLLNDDTLIKVDYEEEKNYLKLNFPEGEKYIWISDPEEKAGKRWCKILPVSDYPVKDSPALLPVNVPAKTNKQFWVTIKVPDTAKEGVYTGSINLFSGKETLAALTLKLKVLPFKLASPKTYYDVKEDFVSSVYYRGRFHPDYPKGSISAEYKSEEQLRAELENMFAHGITNPLCYQGFDEGFLGEYLKIRNEVGMGGEPLYILGVNVAYNTPAAIKKTIEFAKSYGIPEVYFYGLDEATGERLKVQRLAWEATRKAGGKIFVAGYKDKNFELMGDIQDLLICAHHPSKEEAAKWHSVGHKIWCYANPQAGPENPAIFRKNYGFLLWKHNYDGASTYAYQHGNGSIWNDFDDPVYRGHVLAYPTVNGVISTIALEGYREGIDDIRYATTLKLEIEKAKKSRNGKMKKTALEAEKYLDTIDVETVNLNSIRLEIINYILKLKGER